jgi:hypothetical protein
MENWKLDEDFDCIRINGIPVLEQSFSVTEESKKIILLASKAPEMLEVLIQISDWISKDLNVSELKTEIDELIKEATTI